MRRLALLLAVSLSAPALAAPTYDERPLAIPGPPPPNGYPTRPNPPPPVHPSCDTVPARPPCPPPAPPPPPPVYAPPPPAPVVQASPRPERRRLFGVGVMGGALVTGYRDAHAVADPGVSLLMRLRPVPAIGIEALVSHHDQTFGEVSNRRHTTGQLSGAVFFRPKTGFSPYLVTGATLTRRAADDVFVRDGDYQTTQGEGWLYGAHLGLGFEIALGRSLALELEGRAIHWANARRSADLFPAAFQGSAGLVAYF